MIVLGFTDSAVVNRHSTRAFPFRAAKVFPGPFPLFSLDSTAAGKDSLERPLDLSRYIL